jgi:hypothetical protein
MNAFLQKFQDCRYIVYAALFEAIYYVLFLGDVLEGTITLFNPSECDLSGADTLTVRKVDL